MKYGFVNVKREDLVYFLADVKPEAIYPDMSDNEYIALEFDTYEDYTKAQKWVFSHYDFEISDAGKIIGCVYYDENCKYGYTCYVDNTEEQDFTTPFKAEDALLEHYYESFDRK